MIRMDHSARQADRTQDKPVIPAPQIGRQLSSKADVERVAAQHRVTTEAGPEAARQRSTTHGKKPMRSAGTPLRSKHQDRSGS